MNFIKTSDKETKNKLKQSGFTLLNEINGIATFLNDKKMVFDDCKLVYSNKLEV